MQKHQYHNGVKFTRDKKTGYFLNSTIRKRIHRFVWESYYGEIPKGYHIHHIDKDKTNNDISNLAAVLCSEHISIHGKERVKTMHDVMTKNLKENALPKAIEWHKSNKGKQWHKKHYDSMGSKIHQKETMVCEMCGGEYVGTVNGQNKFCSNKCRAAWRRKTGADNETRICVVCGREYMTNKYTGGITCSRSCANRNKTLKRGSFLLP